VKPVTLDELSEALRAPSSVSLKGSGTKAGFCLPALGDLELDMTGYAGIVSHEPADQVVTARAGTTIAELQEELARHSLCLPLPPAGEHGVLLAGFPGTVGGLVSMNLPHALFGQCGGPRDWVLGMTVIRADGAVAKSGSRVVKSVAGFDVHKLVIGARGTLGAVAEVTFRTYPIRALPSVTAISRHAFRAGMPLWVQRTLPSDFRAAVEASWGRLLAEDEASATLWAEVPPGECLPRTLNPHGRDAHATTCDWVIRAGCGAGNLAIPEGQADLMRRTKAALDLTGKFNPGALGVV
jgi:FAD/FMN-containing dehydrogenase